MDKKMLYVMLEKYRIEERKYSLKGEMKILEILDAYNKGEITKDDEVYEFMLEGIKMISNHQMYKICTMVTIKMFSDDICEYLLNEANNFIEYMVETYSLDCGLTISELSDALFSNIEIIYNTNNKIETLLHGLMLEE